MSTPGHVSNLRITTTVEGTERLVGDVTLGVAESGASVVQRVAVDLHGKSADAVKARRAVASLRAVLRDAGLEASEQAIASIRAGIIAGGIS